MNDFGVQKPQVARLANVSAVMRYLLAHGPTSRVDLAAGVGLTQAPMTRIVGLLLKRGLVREEGAQPVVGGRGRPRVPIAIRADAMHIVSVHIGVMHVTVSRVDLAGTVVQSRTDEHQGELAAVVETAAGFCGEMMAAHPAPLLGVGVSIGGWVDAESGVVRRSDPLRWSEAPLRRMLADRLGCPVVVESAVRAHAVADMLFGAVANPSNFLHVFIGNVIEMATVIDGRVRTGLDGFGGILSGWRVDAGAGEAGAEDAISEIAVRDLARRTGLIHETGSFEDVLEVAASGGASSRKARRLFVERARRSARLLASLTFAFGPREIVLSGHAEASSEEIEALKQEFDFLMDRYPRPLLTISPRWQSLVKIAGAAVVLDRVLADHALLTLAGADSGPDAEPTDAPAGADGLQD